MRNLYILIGILFVLTLISCSQSNDDKIIGKWVLEKTNIDKLDFYAENAAQVFLQQADDAINQLTNEIENSPEGDEKQQKVELLNKFIEQRNVITPDSIKNGIIQNYENLAGQMFMNYTANKKFTFTFNNDMVEGIYIITGDSLYTTQKEQPTEAVFIEKLTENDLNIVSDLGDSVKIHMNFRKIN